MSAADKWVGDVPDVAAAEMEALAGILGPEGQRGCARGTTRVELDAPVEGLPGKGGRGSGRGDRLGWAGTSVPLQDTTVCLMEREARIWAQE